MREALFRAAQQGAYFTDEETVGRWQDDRLTDRVLSGSFVALPPAVVPAMPGNPFIVWPYPRGTMHIIDRANCADHFLRANPEYQLVTEAGMGNPVRVPAGPVLLFAPFDAIMPAVRLDREGYLVFAGRRVSVLVNELSLAHLVRHGALAGAVRPPVEGYEPIVAPPRTHVVNGTQITLFKARQMRHVADLADQLAPLGVASLPYVSSPDRTDATEAIVMLSGTRGGVVVRPFGASQGTGVSVVGPAATREAAAAALERLEAAVAGKYGASGAYPVTITPFVESRKIRGSVTDIRMFVVRDPAGGLRAVPGMVRRAETPFRRDQPLTAATALTKVSGSLGGDGPPRVYPATRADVLRHLGLSPDALVLLGLAASTIWVAAVEAEQAARGAPVPFCYGSVDFLVRADDGRPVPIEMNGANVGEHPSVAVRRLELFAEATTATLAALGMSTPSPREPAWAG